MVRGGVKDATQVSIATVYDIASALALASVY